MSHLSSCCSLMQAGEQASIGACHPTLDCDVMVGILSRIPRLFCHTGRYFTTWQNRGTTGPKPRGFACFARSKSLVCLVCCGCLQKHTKNKQATPQANFLRVSFSSTFLLVLFGFRVCVCVCFCQWPDDCFLHSSTPVSSSLFFFLL